MLPPWVPEGDNNGYGSNTPTRHNWTREENKNLMVCYYKSKTKQGIQVLHENALADMKQLNMQRYSIMKNHLLSDLELKELS